MTDNTLHEEVVTTADEQPTPARPGFYTEAYPEPGLTTISGPGMVVYSADVSASSAVSLLVGVVQRLAEENVALVDEIAPVDDTPVMGTVRALLAAVQQLAEENVALADEVTRLRGARPAAAIQDGDPAAVLEARDERQCAAAAVDAHRAEVAVARPSGGLPDLDGAGDAADDYRPEGR